MEISVVIPTLDEAAVLAASLATALAPDVAEVIVVDGGSADDTVDVARREGARVIVGRRGRAAQMNAGAAQARAHVLVFLHADTLLPAGFERSILDALADPGMVGGRFDVRLEPGSFLLRLTAALINLRSRLTRISTGDQAIFVRRQVFEDLGGFPDQPLMEDVEFSRALRRAGRVACLRSRVTTSSRRWRRNGVIRTILLMWSLRFLYFCGVSAHRLQRLYLDAR